MIDSTLTSDKLKWNPFYLIWH